MSNLIELPWDVASVDDVGIEGRLDAPYNDASLVGGIAGHREATRGQAEPQDGHNAESYSEHGERPDDRPACR